jgi:hypothetical protein
MGLRPACGPAKKMKMAPTNVEWVAQVSLLRPGFLPQMGLSRNTQVSKARPGHPLNIWRLDLIQNGDSAACKAARILT